MSDLVATVVAGGGHRNSGLPKIALVMGSLYVGGSGAWRFGPVAAPPHGDEELRSFTLRSTSGDPLAEARAGVGLVLGIPEALEAVGESAWRDQVWPTLELPDPVVMAVAEATRDRGLSLVVTALEGGFVLERFQAGLTDKGWSTLVCGRMGDHLQTQWG